MKKLLCLVVCGALAVGCADLSKYTKTASEWIETYKPKLEALLSKSGSLTERLAKLPDAVPGVPEAKAKAGTTQAKLTALKASVEKLPEAVDEGVKQGDEAKLTELLQAQDKATSEGLASAGQEITALDTQVAELETKTAQIESEKAAAATAVVATPQPFNKTLSSGTSIVGAPTGIEAALVGFIEDASKPVDKDTWFNFDAVTFQTGSAKIDMDKSAAQLGNIAEILKAYPAVSLKIGGYTDNQGKESANKKLSTERAKAVAKAITAKGIAAKRLSPEGYGSAHPVCPANDTEDCRNQNRRIAVRVTAK